jgi:hypothetical protein
MRIRGPRTLIAAMLAALALAAPTAAGGAFSSPQQLPRAEIVSEETRIDKRYRFKIRVRCVARPGEVCAGFVVLSTGVPSVHLPDGMPLTGPRDFKLGAGKARAIGLRLAGYARPEGSRWREARTSKAKVSVYLRNGPGDERIVDVRFKPRRRGGAGR